MPLSMRSVKSWGCDIALLDPVLASILVCTIDLSDLTEDEPNRVLICSRCARRYPVDEQGIPDMVVEEEAFSDGTD